MPASNQPGDNPGRSSSSDNLPGHRAAEVAQVAQNLAATAAALSACFHQDSRYREFYDTRGERFRGFLGIWELVGRVAVIFAEEEFNYRRAHPTHQWQDWSLAVGRMADFVYNRIDDFDPDWRAEAAHLVDSHMGE